MDIDRRKLLLKGSSVGVFGLSGMALAAGAAPGTNPATPPPPSAALAASALSRQAGLTPEAFGAIADGQTDCSDAFDALISVAMRPRMLGDRQRNLPIVLSAGAYRLTRTLTIPSVEITMTGAGVAASALLIDHGDGPGVLCTAGTNLRFTHFSITGTDSRRRSGSGDGLVIRPAPGANYTFRIGIEYVSVSKHPGNGLLLISPEGLRLSDFGAYDNGACGCLIDSTGLENICNQIDFARFQHNGDAGLRVINVANSIFSRVECLNNKGPVQFDLRGRHNTITATDCECFELYDGTKPYVGLSISGQGNIVQHGDFFKLSTAILLKDARNCRVILPMLGGMKAAPMHIGVDVDSASSDNVIDTCNGFFVEAYVRDQSGRNAVLVGGRDLGAAATQRSAVAETWHVSGQIAPSLKSGDTVSYVLDAATLILPAANFRPGAIFTVIIDSGALGVGSVSFDPAYRGIAERIAANRSRRYITCSFVGGADGRSLLRSFDAYD